MLDPFVPVPVGLALGGLLTGKRIDLLGTRIKEPVDRSQLIQIGAIAAAVLLVVLGGLYFLKKSQVDDERDKLAAAETKNSQLQSQISSLSEVAAAAGGDRDAGPADPDAARHGRRVVLGAAGALAHDPVRRLATSFQGTVAGADTGLDDAGARRRPPGAAAIGTANFAAVGTSSTPWPRGSSASARTCPTSRTCGSRARRGEERLGPVQRHGGRPQNVRSPRLPT